MSLLPPPRLPLPAPPPPPSLPPPPSSPSLLLYPFLFLLHPFLRLLFHYHRLFLLLIPCYYHPFPIPFEIRKWGRSGREETAPSRPLQSHLPATEVPRARGTRISGGTGEEKTKRDHERMHLNHVDRPQRSKSKINSGTPNSNVGEGAMDVKEDGERKERAGKKGGCDGGKAAGGVEGKDGKVDEDEDKEDKEERIPFVVVLFPSHTSLSFNHSLSSHSGG
ncbi:hypothetical protein ONZ45_g12101 [Pleurotus djamor]|nr:hypothetical protein ONZ45_g12101 [Pleurotus djamor]